MDSKSPCLETMKYKVFGKGSMMTMGAMGRKLTPCLTM